jgi:hypothetical protein
MLRCKIKKRHECVFVCQSAFWETASEAVVEWEVRNQGYRGEKESEKRDRDGDKM